MSIQFRSPIIKLQGKSFLLKYYHINTFTINHCKIELKCFDSSEQNSTGF